MAQAWPGWQRALWPPCETAGEDDAGGSRVAAGSSTRLFPLQQLPQQVQVNPLPAPPRIPWLPSSPPIPGRGLAFTLVRGVSSWAPPFLLPPLYWQARLCVCSCLPQGLPKPPFMQHLCSVLPLPPHPPKRRLPSPHLIPQESLALPLVFASRIAGGRFAFLSLPKPSPLAWFALCAETRGLAGM